MELIYFTLSCSDSTVWPPVARELIAMYLFVLCVAKVLGNTSISVPQIKEWLGILYGQSSRLKTDQPPCLEIEN
jgi:hypothetical protein